MKQIILLLLKLFFVTCVLLSNLNCAKNKRKKVIVPGDLMIGALLPVHEQPNDAERTCGTIRDQYGVQRVEALLYLLDKFNNKSVMNILPGVKLGLEIRDDCWDASIALEETIDFIKDTISSPVVNETDDDDNDSITSSKQNAISTQYIFTTKTIYRNKTHAIVSTIDNCPPQKNNKRSNGQNKILAVIGPSGSTVAITVQNLLQLFDIPQVGFSATSADLSNKKMYKTFLRVVPSDYLQVRAMIEIVLKMNWTYVFAVYTDGSYGQAGMEAFRNETAYLNICLAEYEKIQEYAVDKDYEMLIRKLNRTTTAKVIVCFCYGETVRGLLGAIHSLNLKGRFLILGSDGWSDRIDVAKDYYDEAYGSLSVKAYSPVVKEFDNYFINLNPSNNLRNIWFTEYWQERFKCYIEEKEKKRFTRPCKTKCPANFEYIGNACYWFPSTRANWLDAQKECKDRKAEFIGLNDKNRLKNMFKYLTSSPQLSLYLSAFHVKFDQTEIFDNLTIKIDKREINIYKCQSKLNTKPKQIKRSTASNKQTLKDECAYLEFESRSQSTNLNYCLNVNDCRKEIYYLCKFEVKTLQKGGINFDGLNENLEESNEALYYTDTLKDYQQDPKMSYVMNSFLAIAYGLNKIHEKYCKNVSGLCDEMKKVNGSILLKYIKQVQFEGITKENIYFYPNGDPPGRYAILNVQKDKNADIYIYKEVGSWDNEKKLNLNTQLLVFPNSFQTFKSQCSEPCQKGYVKQLKQDGQKCCWNCKKCDPHAYLLDEYLCQDCPYGYWPTKNLTGCEKLSLEYIRWNEPASLFALLVSFIGILINTFVTHIFIKFSNTSIVKSTTKELSYIILVGSYFCYIVTIPLVLKPNGVTCYLSRILPGLSLSLVYGALITKTNRIARILSRSKKRILTRKPRFMSIYAQIVITIVIITIECGIIIVSFILEPNISIITYPQRNRPRLQCYYSVLTILGPIGYDLFLVVLCTLYAIRTRNLPENFNEAKFIGFSMYTTCVIWIAFIPLYFGSDFKVITLCLSTSLSATVILVFLFFPKVYIIIFHPERNQRSAFATSKDLRCHFGSSNPVRQDSASDYEKSFVSSSNRKSYRTSVLEKLGIKATLTVSVKSDSASSTNGTKITTMNSSNKYIPKPKNLNGAQDRSLESLVTHSSYCQTIDRSCQTSQELLVPILDNEIRRRKAYGVSLLDKCDLIKKINDRFEEDTKQNNNSDNFKNFGKKFTKSLSFIRQLQQYLADESRLADKINESDEVREKVEDVNNVSLSPITNLESNEENNSEIKVRKSSLDENKEIKITPNRLFKQSFKNIQTKYSKIAENKGLFKFGSTSKRRQSFLTDSLSHKIDEIEKPEIVVEESEAVKAIKYEKTEILDDNNNNNNNNNFNKNNDDFEDVSVIDDLLPTNKSDKEIIQTSSSLLPKIAECIEDSNTLSDTSNDDIDITNFNGKQIDNYSQSYDIDSSISSSLSNLNLKEIEKKDGNINRIIEENFFSNDSDIENDFMLTLDKEDESLDEFKRILSKDNKLVLNWDYAQSSDYL